MREPVLKVKARVTFQVEVNTGDNWGPDCKADQVYKQAVDSATFTIGKLLNESKTGQFRLLGEPKVTCILVEEER